jgi:hypothetical protein
VIAERHGNIDNIHMERPRPISPRSPSIWKFDIKHLNSIIAQLRAKDGWRAPSGERHV